MLKLGLAFALVLSSLSTFAEVVKEARQNDVASKYILDDAGNFFRIVRGNKCQITNAVEDFKISQHPGDVAMVYFKRQGDLYLLKNHDGDRLAQCPKANKSVLVKSIKKYSVVPDTSSLVVNYTLDNAGKLVGYTNTAVFNTVTGVRDYSHNECYGQAGRSFSTIAVFGIQFNGTIVKMRAKTKEVDFDRELNYSSIADFKNYRNVCK